MQTGIAFILSIIHVAVALRVNAPPKNDKETILIDLGANCGNSFARLKEKFPEVNFIENYLWEANPNLLKIYLQDLEKTDPKIHVVPYAAWTEDTTLEFYLTKGQEKWTKDDWDKHGYKCDPHSFSNPSGASSLESTVPRAGEPVQVLSKNFTAWIEELVHVKTLKDASKSIPQIYLKVDIEAAEFSVLDSFRKSAFFCDVSVWMVEWHEHLLTSNTTKFEKAKQSHTEFDKAVNTCKQRGRDVQVIAWY